MPANLEGETSSEQPGSVDGSPNTVAGVPLLEGETSSEQHGSVDGSPNTVAEVPLMVDDSPVQNAPPPPTNSSDTLNARFLVNGLDDYWNCTYSEGADIYWQAPILFNENGKGEVFFESQNGPGNLVWSIGNTLNIFGSGLGLTTFNVQFDSNVTIATGDTIGQLNADVAQGGQLECLKLIRPHTGFRFDN